MLKLRMNSIIQQQTNNSGSNYCKMPDGTLIQWGTKKITPTMSGGIFGYTGGVTVTFDIPFNSHVTVIASPYENAGYWNAGVTSLSLNSFFLTLAGNSQTEHEAYWIAIGRWK